MSSLGLGYANAFPLRPAESPTDGQSCPRMTGAPTLTFWPHAGTAPPSVRLIPVHLVTEISASIDKLITEEYGRQCRPRQSFPDSPTAVRCGRELEIGSQARTAGSYRPASAVRLGFDGFARASLRRPDHRRCHQAPIFVERQRRHGRRRSHGRRACGDQGPATHDATIDAATDEISPDDGR